MQPTTSLRLIAKAAIKLYSHFTDPISTTFCNRDLGTYLTDSNSFIITAAAKISEIKLHLTVKYGRAKKTYNIF